MKIVYKENGVEINGELILLTDIINECNNISLTQDNKVLLEIQWPADRNFDGCFEQIVLPLRNANRIKEIMLDKNVWFGEIAGKHSDIYGTMEESDFTIIKDPNSILRFLASNPSGHDYDHSFIHTFNDEAYDQEEITKEESDEFKKLF